VSKPDAKSQGFAIADLGWLLSTSGQSLNDHRRVSDYILKNVLNGRLSYDEAPCWCCPDRAANSKPENDRPFPWQAALFGSLPEYVIRKWRAQRALQ
jgi:hypothetical protein